MQLRSFLLLGFTGLVVLVAFRSKQKDRAEKLTFIPQKEVFKDRRFIQCSPDWSLLNSDSLANEISILKGWGNYQWAIDSKSDSARLYFQQAMSMYYSFHIIEAMASFKKAEKFDANNPMIFWGQALAYGPNINDFAYSYTPEAFDCAQRAAKLSGRCTVKEKILIKAMSARYSKDSTISRASLNQLYTDGMRDGYHELPNDPDVAAIYADAMMLQHPWDYWKHYTVAQPWTPLILDVLEKTLRLSPMHPGANHYYIHMVEASGNPQRALPSANRLSKLMPSVSHMVHMPSHIYIRSGFYKEGVKVNEMSRKGYNDYLSVYPAVANNAPLYLIHNLHMQTACAMMGSGYEYSNKTANECRASFDSSFMSLPPPFGTFVQYVYMAPLLNNVRFGKWDVILAAPEVPAVYVYANVLYHWGKGIAFASKKDILQAKEELKLLRANLTHPDMLFVMMPFNSPASAAKVMEKLLEGVITQAESGPAAAISFFTEAVRDEEAMIYNEPKDWLLPPRQWLGAALLNAGSFPGAERIFKDDLKENPNNHWSLKGLYEALQRQHKNEAASLIKKQLDKAAITADMKDLPIVF